MLGLRAEQKYALVPPVPAALRSDAALSPPPPPPPLPLSSLDASLLPRGGAPAETLSLFAATAAAESLAVPSAESSAFSESIETLEALVAAARADVVEIKKTRVDMTADARSPRAGGSHTSSRTRLLSLGGGSTGAPLFRKRERESALEQEFFRTVLF